MQKLFRLFTRLALMLAVSLVLLSAAGSVAAAPGPLCYVRQGGPGPDGNSWATAYANPQQALADASCSEIWVAAGVYLPGSSADDSFELKNNTALYGGFAGTETSRAQRDWLTHITILYGGSTHYHVIVADGVNTTAVLDGFVIMHGYASGGPTSRSISSNSGGGVYINGGSPTLANLVVSWNRAEEAGGGMYNDGGNLQLTNITVGQNSAVFNGSGLYNDGGTLQLTNATFVANMSDRSAPVLMSVGGTLTLNHATFSDNPDLNIQAVSSDLTIHNSIFMEPQHFSGGSIFVHDSIVQGGCPSGVTCSNVVDLNPQLMQIEVRDPPMPFVQLVALGGASQAIDAANNATCAASDQRGAARPQGAACDMGSYEFIQPAAGPLCYVDASMTWPGNGGSWAQAYRDLQHALANNNCTEIWVAEGSYEPTGGTMSVDLSFELKNGVAIYGGFAAIETQREQRDWVANETILSGALAPGWNSFNVVTATGVNATAVLDGFTIRDGLAVGLDKEERDGAGVRIILGSPTLANLVITNNTATDFGGGMYIEGGAPSLTRVTFINNTANLGGGLYSAGNFEFSEGIFQDNTAVIRGGALFLGPGSPQLEQVFVENNSAGTSGGGAQISGNASLTNVTFYNNTAPSAGGVLIDDGSPSFNHATFSHNAAEALVVDGGVSAAPLVRNSVFWNHTSTTSQISGHTTFNDSILEHPCPSGVTCNNVIAGDPLLSLPQNNGGFSPSMALGVGSPAIDTADSSTCAAVDQRGAARPFGPGCDMGAYEWGAIPPSAGGPGDTGGPEAAAPTAGKDIAASGLTTLHFGRIWASVPASAIPPGQSDCRIEIRIAGESGQYGFSLDDTVWDVKIVCASGELNIFFDTLTICIRPADNVLGDKTLYHRHAGQGFQAISGGQGPAGYVCGQTRTLSLFTLGQLVLPATGFAPGVVAELGAPSVAYAASDLTLSIPRLGVEMDILGVPQGPNGWDVTWLASNQAGYLYGTAFPTWKGNSVLTAHVWNADNTPGPFHALRSLQHGDRFSISAYGYTYTYEVRSNRLVSESNLNVLTSNSQYSQITLITCETFSESAGGYLYRRAVQAVLVAVNQ